MHPCLILHLYTACMHRLRHDYRLWAWQSWPVNHAGYHITELVPGSCNMGPSAAKGLKISETCRSLPLAKLVRQVYLLFSYQPYRRWQLYIYPKAIYVLGWKQRMQGQLLMWIKWGVVWLHVVLKKLNFSMQSLWRQLDNVGNVGCRWTIYTK